MIIEEEKGADTRKEGFLLRFTFYVLYLQSNQT